MIKEVKDLLESVIVARVPDATVTRSAAEESRAIMARKWPLVSLITNPGTFDESEARTVKYYDDVAKTWKQRYVRGNRVLPVLVRCWAEGEEAADSLFSRIIPAIPSRWEHDDFAGSIEIAAEEHSDHTGNTAKLYLSVAEVRFSIPAAMEPTVVPTIDEIGIAPTEVASPQA